MLPSMLLIARYSPHGEKSTAIIESVWPVSSLTSSALYMKAMSSTPPDAYVSACSGCQETEHTESVWD